MALPGKFAMVFENAIFVVVLRVHAESSCRGKNGKTAILSFMVLEFSFLRNSERILRTEKLNITFSPQLTTFAEKGCLLQHSRVQHVLNVVWYWIWGVDRSETMVLTRVQHKKTKTTACGEVMVPLVVEFWWGSRAQNARCKMLYLLQLNPKRLNL